MRALAAIKSCPWSLWLGVAVLQFALARLSHSMIFGGHLTPSIWLPSGITLGLGILRGPQVVPGIMIGQALLYLVSGSPWQLLIGSSLGNALEVYLSSHWLRRWLDLPGRPIEPRDVFPLTALLAFSVNISAVVGALSMLPIGGAFLRDWWMWWAGDMVGVLALTPVLLLPELHPSTQWRPNRVEELAFWILLVLLNTLLFMTPAPMFANFRLEYLPFLFVAWAALRLGVRNVTFANGAILLISAVGTSQKHGPFGAESLLDSYNRYWAFAGVAGVAGIWLSTLSASRDRAVSELRSTNQALRIEVDERTRAQAGLEDQSARLAATLASILDGVISTDREGRIELMNAEACRMTGWSAEQAVGRDAREILRLEGGVFDTGSLLAAVLASGEPVGDPQRIDGAQTVRSATGAAHPVTLVAAPRRTGGSVQGVVLALRDVSKARELDRMKSDFVAAVSHELRTPLTSIRGFLDTVLADAAMPAEVRTEFLGIARDQTARLMSLVSDILKFSRLQGGTDRPVRERVDLAALCGGVLRDLAATAAAKGQQLRLETIGGPAEVWGDPGQLRSLVENLAGNACKFTQEGGLIQIRLHREAGAWRFAVADNGPGIPQEHLGRIFDRFYRFERPGQIQPGTGLGLSIVREIALRHGTEVVVQSENGRGTEFSVVFEAA